MIRPRFSLLSISCALLSICVACGPSKSGTETPVSNSTALVGAGSTFIYPAITRWVDSFQKNRQGLQINYQSIGSGGGIQQLKKGLVDFGASDAALADDQLKEMPAVIQIPESAGPVCITYNLPDLKNSLRLSDATLAGIFMGSIKNWQDPAIKKDNPESICRMKQSS